MNPRFFSLLFPFSSDHWIHINIYMSIVQYFNMMGEDSCSCGSAKGCQSICPFPGLIPTAGWNPLSAYVGQLFQPVPQVYFALQLCWFPQLLATCLCKSYIKLIHPSHNLISSCQSVTIYSQNLLQPSAQLKPTQKPTETLKQQRPHPNLQTVHPFDLGGHWKLTSGDLVAMGLTLGGDLDIQSPSGDPCHKVTHYRTSRSHKEEEDRSK